MSTLFDIAGATIAAHGMFADSGPVVVMVSGGADSVSLLRALVGGLAGAAPLSVLHVDHGLRGAASEGDAAFVVALCAELGVACRVAPVDVAAYAAERGLNLEDAGRRVRYAEADAELDARCADAGVPADRGRIATAHTFDDRAETLLMRLAQGSGAGGLLSLSYVRARVVRPFLECPGPDGLAYLGGLGQEWREDATNLDTSRLRARVRADLMPVLRSINPRFDAALLRTMTVLGDEDDLLEGMAQGFVREFTKSGPGELSFDRSRMATLSRVMLRRTVRTAIFDAFPDASRLEFDHVEAVCDGMGDASFARDLPDGLRAFSEYGRLIISRDAGPAGSLAPCLLPIPGTVDLGRAGVITATLGGPEDPGTGPHTALIDADVLDGPLEVGPVRPGDRMRPFGMTGSRKLQDVLTDAKVPARTRPLVPVVRDGERIVWVAGVRSSEHYRIGPETVRTVRLTWTPCTAEGDIT